MNLLDWIFFMLSARNYDGDDTEIPDSVGPVPSSLFVPGESQIIEPPPEDKCNGVGANTCRN